MDNDWRSLLANREKQMGSADVLDETTTTTTTTTATTDDDFTTASSTTTPASGDGADDGDTLSMRARAAGASAIDWASSLEARDGDGAITTTTATPANADAADEPTTASRLLRRRQHARPMAPFRRASAAAARDPPGDEDALQREFRRFLKQRARASVAPASTTTAVADVDFEQLLQQHAARRTTATATATSAPTLSARGDDAVLEQLLQEYLRKRGAGAFLAGDTTTAATVSATSTSAADADATSTASATVAPTTTSQDAVATV